MGMMMTMRVGKRSRAVLSPTPVAALHLQTRSNETIRCRNASDFLDAMSS